jgi:hypothetical protein
MQKETYWLKNFKSFQILKITGVLLIPVVLYFAPLEWIKSRDSVCLFKNLTGHECYGCGMTRAILSAIHFQFENAFYYNRLFVIVFPLLIYIWVKTLANAWKGRLITFMQ